MATLKTASELASNSPLKTALELALEGRPLTRGQQELLQKNREVVNKLLSAEPEDFLSRVEVRAGGQRPIKVLPNSRAHTRTYNKMMDLIDSGEWDKMTDAERKSWTDKTFKGETEKISKETKSKATAEEPAKKEPAKKEPAKKKATKPKSKAGIKQTFEEASSKSEKKAQEAVDRATKKAKDTVDKTAKQVKKEAKEAAVDVAEKAGKTKGVGKVVGKTVGKVLRKVAVPVAAAGEAMNVGNLLLNEDARQEARDYVAGMEDDNILMRAGKGFLSPTDTIYGAGSAFADALSSMEAGQQALYEAGEMRKRLAPKYAANQAKGEARKAALESALTGVEMEALEKAAVRDSQLLKELGAVQSPEQARALYDSAFGDPEPTAEGVVDQGLADVDVEEPAAPAEPAAKPEPAAPATPKAAPKAEAMRPAATAATEAALGPVEEATAEPEVDYTDQAVGLFKNTHGTEFDPKSRMDREKLEKMKGMLAKQGGLGDMSANQFALQVYRNS